MMCGVIHRTLSKKTRKEMRVKSYKTMAVLVLPRGCEARLHTNKIDVYKRQTLCDGCCYLVFNRFVSYWAPCFHTDYARALPTCVRGRHRRPYLHALSPPLTLTMNTRARARLPSNNVYVALTYYYVYYAAHVSDIIV